MIYNGQPVVSFAYNIFNNTRSGEFVVAVTVNVGRGGSNVVLIPNYQNPWCQLQNNSLQKVNGTVVNILIQNRYDYNSNRAVKLTCLI